MEHTTGDRIVAARCWDEAGVAVGAQLSAEMRSPSKVYNCSVEEMPHGILEPERR